MRFFASEQFKVKIPRIGTEIDVPVNQTMLDALESAGVEVIFAAKVSADYARCRFWKLRASLIIAMCSSAKKKKPRTPSSARACHE